MKTYILIFLAVALIGGAIFGMYYVLTQGESSEQEPQGQNGSDTMQSGGQEPVGSSDPTAPSDDGAETVIGTSLQGRAITAYHYGQGDTELLFMGGMHGGYSWNTVLLAYEFMDYVQKNPGIIPSNVRVTVIPVLNPDGLHTVVGTTGRFTQADIPADTVSGRFNANNVDLNRNFDCDWQATATWQNRTVSGGNRPFSEPESQALRDYAQARKPSAVVIWYSAAGGVFLSECGNGALPETRTIANAYGQASRYSVYEKFDFYEITGDAANWLARNNIPAFSVLLTTHEDTEWEKNRAGIEALLEHYAE